MKCYYCNEDFSAPALRPYGPNGEFICFPCATATPEREEEVKKRFIKAVNDIQNYDTVILTDTGPRGVTEFVADQVSNSSGNVTSV